MKMSDVLLRAVNVVLTRSGDVSTEDGCFATCDTDEMIRLDYELSEFFNLDSDDLELRHIPLIKAKAKNIDVKIESYDRLESENARLREFVKKVAELDIETFHFETQDGDEDFIEYICTDILDDANELLEELEKSNE